MIDRQIRTYLAVAAAALATAACAGTNQSTGAVAAFEGSAGSNGNNGVTVLEGERLPSSGTVIDALSGRLANVRVERSGAACPQFMYRGRSTAELSSEPSIYVDGTRMADSCALDRIQANEVERVEIHGTRSARALEGASAGWQILVFRTTRS